MIDGTTIKLRGVDYVIPPLSLGQVERLSPIIDKLGAGTDFAEKFTAMVTIIHAALSTNYPEMEIEKVKEMLDLGNLKSAMEAAIGPPGFLQTSSLAGNFGMMS